MSSLVRQESSIPVARPGLRAGRRSLLAALLFGVFGLLIAGQLAIAWVKIDGDGGIERYIRLRADFRAVLTGGLMIREGNGPLLYDEAAQHEAQVRLLAPHATLAPDVTLPNSHPPYESLFAALFGGLPSGVPFLAWTLLEVVTFAGALWLLARAAPLGPTARWLAIAGALAYQPFHALLLNGQSSTLALLGLCGIYAALKAGRPGWAGVALALVLIKPQLAVPTLLLLALTRHWRPIVIAGAIQGALAVAIMPILGVAWPLRYLRYLAGSADWDHRMFEYPPGMYSWRGIVALLIEPRAPGLAGPLVTILAGLTIALIVGGWWRGRGASAAPARGIGDPLWALTVVGTLLIAHHLYIHDLTLLVLPAWLIIAGATAGGWPQPRLWIALVVVGSLLPIVTATLAQRQWQSNVPSVALMVLAASGLAWLAWRNDCFTTSHSKD